jgi:hypothetical protein
VLISTVQFGGDRGILRRGDIDLGSQGYIFYGDWKGGLWVLSEVLGEVLRHSSSHHIVENVAK